LANYELPRAEHLYDHLPELEESMLSRDFCDLADFEIGKGGADFERGIALWNEGKPGYARGKLIAACRLGLSTPYRSHADLLVAQVGADYGETFSVFRKLYRSLQAEIRTASTVFEAASRLSYFYEAAGRERERESLAALANDANNRLSYRVRHNRCEAATPSA
jgi:hypothetical protein